MRRDLSVVLFLLLITLPVFLPLAGHDFINSDDGTYIYRNPWVREGLTLRGAAWAFTSFHAANWHPLTWLSHMLDVTLFGVRPGPHHLMSLLLHLLNAVVLFLLLQRMTGARAASAFAAALFAVHPLHVESVAWAAERKDVLSAALGLLALGAYLRYLRRPSPARYLPVPALLALGLAAKPMLVTLPLLMLLLDAWPLGRTGAARAACAGPRFPARLLLEKAPLVALAVTSAVVTLRAQAAGHAIGGATPLFVRAANALSSYALYQARTFWPANLALPYPYPTGPEVVWRGAAGAALMAAAAAAAWRLRRRWPFFLAGWGWFVVTLLPVIGLVQIGSQAMADRYTYLPLIGVFMALAWGATRAAGASLLPRGAATLLAAIVLPALMLLSWRQVGFWRDSATLFRRALAVTEGNWMASFNLGNALLSGGDPAAAAVEFRRALSLNPSMAEGHYNLATALVRLGRDEEAAVHYRETLRLEPAHGYAHNNLAVLLFRSGLLDEAARHCREALRLDPRNAEAHNNLGLILAAAGEKEEALTHFREAMRLRPGKSAITVNMADVLRDLGRGEEAAAWYREASRDQAAPGIAP